MVGKMNSTESSYVVAKAELGGRPFMVNIIKAV